MPAQTPPKYGSRRVYGPFHRLISPTQNADAIKIAVAITKVSQDH